MVNKKKILFEYSSSSSFLVDLILRELNVGSDGRVFYDNLVHMMTQPLGARH
jgi:hypothetical protein